MLQQTSEPHAWKTFLDNIKPMWNAVLNYTAEGFARVVAPTLVLLGDRDSFVPVEEGLDMYHHLPNAEFAVIPACRSTALHPARGSRPARACRSESASAVARYMGEHWLGSFALYMLLTPHSFGILSVQAKALQSAADFQIIPNQRGGQ